MLLSPVKLTDSTNSGTTLTVGAGSASVGTGYSVVVKGTGTGLDGSTKTDSKTTEVTVATVTSLPGTCSNPMIAYNCATGTSINNSVSFSGLNNNYTWNCSTAGGNSPPCSETKVMSGSLSVPSCTIPSGSSSCSSLASWSIENPQAIPTAITASAVGNTIPAVNENVTDTLTTPQSDTKSVPIPYLSSPRTFYLYNNSNELFSSTAYASCASPTVWNITSGTCAPTAVLPPTTPTEISASAVSTSQINVSWNPSTGGNGSSIAYNIYRCTGAGCTATQYIDWGYPTSYSSTGLTCNTTYGYRVRAYDGRPSFSNYSLPAYATTFACALTVTTTTPVTNITRILRIGGGTVVSNGGATISVSGIVWSTSANPTTANSKTTDGWATGGPWTDTMSILVPSTTYHYRAYATNSVGTSYGADVTFTTTANSTAPTCTTTTPATNITSTTATISGNVTSDGGSAVTSRGIAYGISSNTTGGPTIAGTTGTYSRDLTGLTANTTYHYRCWATNIVDTGYGADKTFVTAMHFCHLRDSYRQRLYNYNYCKYLSHFFNIKCYKPSCWSSDKCY